MKWQALPEGRTTAPAALGTSPGFAAAPLPQHGGCAEPAQSELTRCPPSATSTEPVM
jgi:hypothetical protein